MKHIIFSIKNKIHQTKIPFKGLFFWACSFYLFCSTTYPAYASGIEGSKFYTGTKKLIEDATGALNILGPLVTVLVVIYYFIRKSAADELDHKKWDSRIITAIICGIGITAASVLINMFVSYYS